jgi:hypothetical protein
MNEIWKPVIGFEGKYEVSSLGRVRSIPHQIIRNGYPVNVVGRVLKGFKHNYYYVFLGGKNQRAVHRLVCEAFHGDPQGREVNHIDANPFNNCVENLEWVTRSENRRHTLLMGNHNRARLTGGQVLQIRERLNAGETGISLAKEYGVSRHAITNIKLRHCWGCV